MARDQETLQLQAKNNHVYTWVTRAGYRWVVCARCEEKWRAPLGRGGWPTKTWFLCPRHCNLAQRHAAKFLREMEAGTRPHDVDLEAACRERLDRARQLTKRAADAFLTPGDLSRLTDDIERLEDWHRRHSEWTPELEEAWRNFE